MDKIKILWADDEINLLKPHILFLNDKGYEVITAMSGDEALDIVKENKGLHAVLLDENMPGLSGLDTLLKIKQVNNDLPVVMGATLIFATIFVFINIIVDIVYGILDPRVRVK